MAGVTGPGYRGVPGKFVAGVDKNRGGWRLVGKKMDSAVVSAVLSGPRKSKRDNPPRTTDTTTPVMENVATDEDWRACFSEAAPGLVLFARQFVQSLADAEDIVQDAFVRFWRKQHSIQNRGLLFAAVRSIALDSLRRDARRARREITASADSEQVSIPKFDTDSDEQRALSAAVDRLPPDQREVLVMKIWNDLTFAEIGTALSISQNTAASRYRYALASLKKSLVPHE